jgi:hypothetical protein
MLGWLLQWVRLQAQQLSKSAGSRTAAQLECKECVRTVYHHLAAPIGVGCGNCRVCKPRQREGLVCQRGIAVFPLHSGSACLLQLGCSVGEGGANSHTRDCDKAAKLQHLFNKSYCVSSVVGGDPLRSSSCSNCDVLILQLIQLWEVIQLALLLKVLRQYILANDFAGTLSR